MTTNQLGAVVKQELADDRRYHPNLGGVTRGGLANHYPMTLLALDGLGASDAEVNAFRRQWGRHRAALDTDLGLSDEGVVTLENWPAYLGHAERLLEFRRVFEALLAMRPASEVVASTLATMRDGLPMGLFHPVIRLSFACEQQDAGMIADALAYAAIRFADLFRAPSLTPPASGDISPAQVWQRIASGEPIEVPPGAALRVCEQLSAAPALQRAALPDGLALRVPAICALALRLYLHEPALTTLHAVTAAQALAQLTTSPELWTRYWIWLTGLFVEKGRPAVLPGAVAPGALNAEHDWPALSRQARASSEVHLIKMAYTCRWLDAQLGPEPLYRLAVLNMVRAKNAHPPAIEGALAVPLG